MYLPDCGPVVGLSGLRCLSLTGWLFSIFFTYSGFALMLAGVVAGANLHTNIRNAWRELRSQNGSSASIAAAD